MAKLITRAFDPKPADPDIFVDRVELVDYIAEILETYIDSPNPSTRLALVGAKGVGKTILTRKVLRQLEGRSDLRFILVEIDGRGLGYRPFLAKTARELTEKGLAFLRADGGPNLRDDIAPLEVWLRVLGELAISDTITEAETQSIARTYGASAGVDSGLLGVLTTKGLFQWSEQRLVGQSSTRTRRVTDELLHAAIEEVLGELAYRHMPVVMFFNDLDQALDRESPEILREKLGKLVALEPCIQVINVRPEVLYDDLRRESEAIEVPSLTPEVLMDLYEKRCEEELRPGKRDDVKHGSVRDVALQLSRINGNPWAFLSWLQNALRTDFPPKRISCLDDAFKIVQAHYPTVDRELLCRAVAAADKWIDAGGWCTRDALETGGPLRPKAQGPDFSGEILTICSSSAHWCLETSSIRSVD